MTLSSGVSISLSAGLLPSPVSFNISSPVHTHHQHNSHSHYSIKQSPNASTNYTTLQHLASLASNECFEHNVTSSSSFPTSSDLSETSNRCVNSSRNGKRKPQQTSAKGISKRSCRSNSLPSSNQTIAHSAIVPSLSTLAQSLEHNISNTIHSTSSYTTPTVYNLPHQVNHHKNGFTAPPSIDTGAAVSVAVNSISPNGSTHNSGSSTPSAQSVCSTNGFHKTQSLPANCSVSTLPSAPPTTTTSSRHAKGLRHFSVMVCQRLQECGHSSYNDIADQLVYECRCSQTNGTQLAKYDEKNIRRRIYDALNVLLAMDIIEKDKKKILWKGIKENNIVNKLNNANKQKCSNGIQINQDITINKNGKTPFKNGKINKKLSKNKKNNLNDIDESDEHLFNQYETNIKEIKKRILIKQQELFTETKRYLIFKNIIQRNRLKIQQNMQSNNQWNDFNVNLINMNRSSIMSLHHQSTSNPNLNTQNMSSTSHQSNVDSLINPTRSQSITSASSLTNNFPVDCKSSELSPRCPSERLLSQRCISSDSSLVSSVSNSIPLSISPISISDEKIYLPFVLLSAHPDTNVDIQILSDRSRCEFYFDSVFHVYHSDELLETFTDCLYPKILQQFPKEIIRLLTIYSTKHENHLKPINDFITSALNYQTDLKFQKFNHNLQNQFTLQEIKLQHHQHHDSQENNTQPINADTSSELPICDSAVSIVDNDVDEKLTRLLQECIEEGKLPVPIKSPHQISIQHSATCLNQHIQ